MTTIKQQRKELKKEDNSIAKYMVISMCLGLSLGICFGVVFGNIAIGPIGMCLGMCAGLSIGRYKKDQNTKLKNAPKKE
ncbi:hypothetical protein ACFL1N_17705 [Thermodesulfobacteriota bacterium]